MTDDLCWEASLCVRVTERGVRPAGHWWPLSVATHSTTRQSQTAPQIIKSSHKSPPPSLTGTRISLDQEYQSMINWKLTRLSLCYNFIPRRNSSPKRKECPNTKWLTSKVSPRSILYLVPLERVHYWRISWCLFSGFILNWRRKLSQLKSIQLILVEILKMY